MKAKTLLACAPLGDMSVPPMPAYRCDCGETLRPVPRGELDWIEVDSAGRAWVVDTPTGLVENPAKWWADLAKGDINSYSMLKAHLTLGNRPPWEHSHRIAERLTPPCSPDRVPWCCEQPMHAVPVGWRCRVRNTVTAYVDGAL